VAEEGYVGTAERFIKVQKDFGNVLTIVKTAARWPAHIPNAGPLTTEFIVSNDWPYFSFVTMIGPSPGTEYFLHLPNYNR